MTNLFEIAKHIIGGPPMPTTAGPQDRADLPDERQMLGDPLSLASPWYTMTGPQHCACKRCAVGWPHLRRDAEAAR